ncbi:MAG: patatin-like phospholipase family protein [Solirubrobacterales bacterium]
MPEAPSNRQAPRPATAFVLSGGASLGAIQAGMLRALFERGIEPDLVLGSSVGALNGAYIASRPPTVETARTLAAVWRGVRRSDIFPLNPLAGLAGFLGQRQSMLSARGLRRTIARHVELDRLEHASVPLHVIATDLFSGAERRLSHGDAVSAIHASAAIPGVFKPVDWEDTKLIDGGIANNTPITHAIELGAERIYVLPTGMACALSEPPRGALAMSLHAMSILVTRRLTHEIENLADRAELIVLPPPCPLDVLPIDFSHAEELIDRGYEDARAYLEGVRPGEGPRVPFSLTAHSHRVEAPDAEVADEPSTPPR